MIETNTYHADVVTTVAQGLTKMPKRLPSWLFYDEIGDKIFQEIMRMPEYYLTDCELEILNHKKDRLLRQIGEGNCSFKLVELGAGDGTKTEVLLSHFLNQGADFTYVPIDISEAVLNQLSSRLRKTLPQLKIQPENGLYHEALQVFSASEERKLILFLGANIGNFTKEEATAFIKQLASSMHADDLLMIGFDLKKDPRLIQAAYDDDDGVTRKFNLNLLERINRELGGEFDTETFTHYPFYDPESGVTKSYLVSQLEQEVFIAALDKTIHFDKWEIIHTEVSLKYDKQMIYALAKQAGLKVIDQLYDGKGYFCDVLFTPGHAIENSIT